MITNLNSEGQPFLPEGNLTLEDILAAIQQENGFHVSGSTAESF